MRGTERVHQEFPLRFQMLLIVTRMGRDYRPGLRQRIEQVARKGSPSSLYSNARSASFQNQLENAPQIRQIHIEQIANKITSRGCHLGIKTTPCRKLSQR